MNSDYSYALHTDKYQINMMYAYWKHGTHNRQTVFEAYFRKNPFNNGYTVFAGLERMVRYIENLRFTESDIDYLATQEENYDQAFLDELRQFKFTGNIYSVQEGEIVFPNEPLIRVEARVFEAQLIETALLNFMNYQTLIATKASRIMQVTKGDTVVEFGSRRAQETDAALWGARAAYIAGFDGTSNVLAGKMFHIPTAGTNAHSWIQNHETEYEAFEQYITALPDQSILLVDTYDTLSSGIPNAIKIGRLLEKQGKRLKAIRLDSGDLARLSIEGRKMLDEAGMEHVQIMASSDLDEEVILHLKMQGAKIDSWGIGTKLITGGDWPALGGVYKLVAREVNGKLEPVIKLSEDAVKITTPGPKKTYRIINRETNKSEGDYIAFSHEEVTEKPLKMFDPIFPHKYKYVENYEALDLMQPIFMNGKRVYDLPSMEAIRAYHQQQIGYIWDETLRLLNPQTYFVDLSLDVWNMKQQLIKQHSKRD
ncbi:MAG TPA: nicotinate phosphoribosyltransferase [Bacillota bacterium]|nr:nicotinate phosphoribosyltransferase [Bacillota bacterium]